MLIGQDPTIRRKTERVKQALMLDQPNGQLSRWLKTLFGAKRFEALTLYATNLVKCTLGVVPSSATAGGLKFLRPYFENCRTYLAREIGQFKPDIVLALGEPAHILLAEQFNNRQHIPQSMKQAFTGQLFRAKLDDVEFDYSPCLHIQTFRVAETYGDGVKRFKAGLLTRVEPH
jgi:uracil-DNA glycosylase